MFLANPYDPVLRNHQLKGEFIEYRSINISGDLRAHYYVQGDDYVFVVVGTHAQLYK